MKKIFDKTYFTFTAEWLTDPNGINQNFELVYKYLENLYMTQEKSLANVGMIK